MENIPFTCKIHRLLIALFLAAFLGPGVHAQCNGQARAVVDSILNLNPSQAQTQISRWSQADPNHPMLDFYRALTVLTRAYTNDEGVTRQAEDDALTFFNKVVRSTESNVESGSAAPDTRLAYGLSQALRASIYFTHDKQLKAYDFGFKGREALQNLINEYPEMEDAYLGLGLYEYHLGMSTQSKGLTARLMKMSGDSDLGISYLERAVETATVAGPEAARVLLMELQLDEAGMCRYGDLARQMHQRYPGNETFSLIARIIPLQCRLAEAENIPTAPSAGITLNSGCTGL